MGEYQEYQENQYLNLVRTILRDGSHESTRNGNVLSIFGHSMRFQLKEGILPLLTTKKMAWKSCFKELMWFVRGETDNKILQSQDVHIWDGNASRDFLDERGLFHHKEGDLGPVYGFQWRHWNAQYDGCYNTNGEGYGGGKGIDQLSELIIALKNKETRNSRRLVISSWNPEQLDEMALPPCHILMQFHVKNNTHLSCSLYQRSGDVGLGVPFNIASYSMLTHLIAKHCDLIADEFVYFLGNAHIYEEHIEPLQLQLTRNPRPFPKIKIIKQHERIEDYDLVNDIQWFEPYIFHNPIKMKLYV
jgi:thymidylate synthase